MDFESSMQQKIRQEELAQEIAETHGVSVGEIFYRLPGELPPGGLYTTPGRLVELGVTRYSKPYLHGIIRGLDGVGQIGGSQVILNPEAVQEILDRENRRKNVLGIRGNKPGIKLSRPIAS